MDFTSPALTALFIALVYTLIRVVTHFITKRNGNGNGHKSSLTAEQEALLKKIDKHVEALEKMHDVYDENHVPSWYVPAGLLDTVKEVQISLKILDKEINETLNEIKAGHTILVDKLSDLISSQRLITERLGDLISKLNKVSN